MSADDDQWAAAEADPVSRAARLREEIAGIDAKIERMKASRNSRQRALSLLLRDHPVPTGTSARRRSRHGR